MQLLEINYTEKYDTFTGYLANVPDYFRYEVNREQVELTPINKQFDDLKDFIEDTLKTNPHASFLVDPIEIKEINYKELERYKRLSLTTLDRQSWITAIFRVKTIAIVVSLLLLSGASYYTATTYLDDNPGSKLIIPKQLEFRKKIQYFYKIHLVNGGTLEGFELERNNEKIVIKNKKGLEITLKLPAVKYIEKIQQDNRLSRTVIYGTKP